LAPGASADLAIKFQPSPTAEQKSYIMTIKEKYDSPEFKNAAEDVKISIPVKQKPRINTGTIEVMPDNISVGSETNVMFGINNTGKVLLYNVMAKFEGDSIQTSDAYVGNIKPGETGNVDTMISGIAPTMDDGKIKITISFEDENGVKTELAKEMSLTVNEEITDPAGDMEAGNMDGTNDMAQNQSFFSKHKMAIIAAAVLLAAAVGMLILKKKKQKKASEEEGMDDEIS
ncbi:MAG: CARDB domain-containing protein, partial [Clostridium sp.]